MQKPLLTLALLLILTIHAKAQREYWQQEVNFKIDVRLDDTNHTLHAFETIEYINNSPDTLKFIWIHLWPNAYRNDKTAFTDQSLENGSTRFYFSTNAEKGYINKLAFKVENVTAQLEDHPEHIDIAKLILPQPLLPGKKISISTPFHVKLPFNISRGGHVEQSYQVTQWFPKPAVYDSKGWHPMPYLDQGEFYSEFGTYEVKITLPANYVVAATGELLTDSEVQWLKQRSDAKLTKDTLSDIIPASSSEMKSIVFSASNVHDFAWFADKRFIVEQDTLKLEGSNIISIMSFYNPRHTTLWKGSTSFTREAIRYYSERVGPYPYSTVSVVQGPESFGGGMEYPTITVISPVDDIKTLDKVITHEVGHNWFYGLLASNERDHPWLDEGLNSYFEEQLFIRKYGRSDATMQIAFETRALALADQPITTKAADFNMENYGLVAYYKTSEWLRYVESTLTTVVFDKAMHQYFSEWKFRHPYPSDFRNSFVKAAGKDADTLFTYLDKRGVLPSQVRKGSTVASVFSIKKIGQYLKKPTQNMLLFGPALGFNAYDKLMLFGFITNLKLPPSKFQFLLAPGYGIGSSNLVGTGFASYSFYSPGTVRKIEPGIAFSRFTISEFTPPEGSTIYTSFQKIVPGFRIQLKPKNARSTITRTMQFKSFFISEESLRFSRDSVFTGNDTLLVDRYGKAKKDRTLLQLKFVLENNRALYPFKAEVKIEQGESFIRTAFTGNYFFNYPDKGGLSFRLFAGKFLYTGSKTVSKQFATDRYHLNMTGPNGFEDYTYSDYFAGRNKFEGFLSQQIMVRDGGFKVRTDLLADEVGKTDNWLAAINLSTTIPASINPLSLLPIKIPIRLFLDIGTQAEAWKDESGEDHFLYDMGIHIPFLRETVNLYIPLLYSKVYRDYNRSTLEKKGRFWKTISFSIDISNFSFRKFHPSLHL